MRLMQWWIRRKLCWRCQQLWPYQAVLRECSEQLEANSKSCHDRGSCKELPRDPTLPSSLALLAILGILCILHIPRCLPIHSIRGIPAILRRLAILSILAILPIRPILVVLEVLIRRGDLSYYRKISPVAELSDSEWPTVLQGGGMVSRRQDQDPEVLKRSYSALCF